MTDRTSAATASEPEPLPPTRGAATRVYDSSQLQTVIDRLEAAHRAAKALAGGVGEDSDATALEVIELRLAVGKAVAAVMSFQPRRKEP